MGNNKIENQYTNDIFKKLAFRFKKGKKLLDVGCGPGTDAEVFINKYELDTYGTDVYKDKNIKTVKELKFNKGSIFKLPYKTNTFDYVFLHDVLHHIDEKGQRIEKHIEGLEELERVCKKNGTIIILEANRFNPLSYPHMVLIRKHNHFKQGYFIKLVSSVFGNVKFRHFESHYYPQNLLKLFKVYEKTMEKLPILKPFLMYNVAIIKNNN